MAVGTPSATVASCRWTIVLWIVYPPALPDPPITVRSIDATNTARRSRRRGWPCQPRDFAGGKNRVSAARTNGPGLPW